MVYYHIDMEVDHMYQGITTVEADALCIGLIIFLVLMGALIQYAQSERTG